MIVDVLLVLTAIVATVFVARASNAIVNIRKDVAATRKQAKAVLTMCQRTNASAERILKKQYEFQRFADILLLDPKVQAALNRHDPQ